MSSTFIPAVVTTHATHLVIACPFEALALVKTVPGRRWDDDRKLWLAPLDSLGAVVDVFGMWPGGLILDGMSDRPEVTSDRITWTCDECQGPILAGTGYLYVNAAEMARYHVAEEAWANAGDGEWPDPPVPARWHVSHGSCVPDDESCSGAEGCTCIYVFRAVEDVGTHRQLLEFLGGTSGSMFGEDIDWRGLVRRALDGLPGSAYADRMEAPVTT